MRITMIRDLQYWILAILAAVSVEVRSSALACACCGTYQVVGVAANDVLNIRFGPGANYRKVGAIPSGSSCVYKTGSCRRRWCEVEYVGQSGWVNTRYLRFVP